MVIIEAGVMIGAGYICYRMHKAGVLNKFVSGIIGQADRVANKMRDPVVDMKLKAAGLIDFTEKLATTLSTVSGEKEASLQRAETTRSALLKAEREHRQDLQALTEKYGDLIPAEEATPLAARKQMIEVMRKTAEKSSQASDRWSVEEKKIEGKLRCGQANLGLLQSIIKSAETDRSILDLRANEISSILSENFDMDDVIVDLARVEGETKGMERAAQLLGGAPKAAVSVSDLEI